jgi:hypothetical protein
VTRCSCASRASAPKRSRKLTRCSRRCAPTISTPR